MPAIISVVLSEIANSLCSFSRKYLPSLNSSSLSISALLMMFCSGKKKKKSSKFNLQLICTHALQDNHYTFIISKRALCILPISSHRIITKNVLWSWDLITLIISTTSTRIYLREAEYLSVCLFLCGLVENIRTTHRVLIDAKVPSCYLL